MAITFNITPPISVEEVDAAVEFLFNLGGTATLLAPTKNDPKVDEATAEGGQGMTLEQEIESHDHSSTDELAKSSTGHMIPWDERIHSGSRTVLKDGSWKLKRNVDPELVKTVESELFRVSCAWKPTAPEPGIQSESASEATPPPGAVEALNATKPIAPPPPPAAEVRYKHGDQTFTKADLLAAKWSEEQIAQLETVEVSQPTPAAPTNFAEVATRIHAEGLDVPGVIDPKIAEIAAGLGKPNVNQLALCAAPANADVLAGLAAALWPSA